MSLSMSQPDLDESAPRRAAASVCGCGRRSASLTQVHCVTCHHQFSGITSFDRHRDGPHEGERVCLDPAGIMDKKGAAVFEPSQERHGVVWRFAASRKQRTWGDPDGVV